MDSLDLKTFSQRVNHQLFDHIIPFWSGLALDEEQGGWMGWLSNDLQSDRTQPKGLILNSRILWAFSAVHQARPDEFFRQMADRAFDYVMNRFWDPQYGGAFWRLDDAGRVMDDSKKIYGQAFYIYALSEYHRAFGASPALVRARQLFELIEQHAHDSSFDGYLEVCRRDWSEADAGARLSDKDMNEKKSMNNHLHVLEAYTNLYRILPGPRLEQRLCELIQLFERHILDSGTNHLHHFFDERWLVRSNSYTFGHDIEATWLLCEAAVVRGAPDQLRQVEAVVLPIAEVVLEQGLDKNGALHYEGRGGKIIDAGKEYWPQAEAVVGFLNAFQISRDEKYLKAALRVWDFIEKRLMDQVYGEWFWRITPEGEVDASLPKVSEWKGPYHGARACLEILKRLLVINRQPVASIA